MDRRIRRLAVKREHGWQNAVKPVSGSSISSAGVLTPMIGKRASRRSISFVFVLAAKRHKEAQRFLGGWFVIAPRSPTATQSFPLCPPCAHFVAKYIKLATKRRGAKTQRGSRHFPAGVKAFPNGGQAKTQRGSSHFPTGGSLRASRSALARFCPSSRLLIVSFFIVLSFRLCCWKKGGHRVGTSPTSRPLIFLVHQTLAKNIISEL